MFFSLVSFHPIALLVESPQVVLSQFHWDSTGSVPTHPGRGYMEAESVRSCDEGLWWGDTVSPGLWVTPWKLASSQALWVVQVSLNRDPWAEWPPNTQGHTVRDSLAPGSQGWTGLSLPSQSVLQGPMATAVARYVTASTTPPATTSPGPVTAAQDGRGHGVIKVRIKNNHHLVLCDRHPPDMKCFRLCSLI